MLTTMMLDQSVLRFTHDYNNIVKDNSVMQIFLI